jgi:hypothetical protein
MYHSSTGNQGGNQAGDVTVEACTCCLRRSDMSELEQSQHNVTKPLLKQRASTIHAVITACYVKKDSQILPHLYGSY